MKLKFLSSCFAVAAVGATATTAPPQSTVEIADGVYMPIVNLGGVASSPGNYSLFLDLGGRGLDTAFSYGTDVQEAVGHAINTTSVPRSEIFITTKVMCCPAFFSTQNCERYRDVNTTEQIERDLQEIGVDQVDLMLLHWPCKTAEETAKTYGYLEQALAEGKTRAIGVSNFNVTHYKYLEDAKVKPAVNQCEMSIGHHDDATIEFSIQHNITYQAWSPLGGLSHIDILHDPDVKKIAAKYNKSPAQVALRWVVQRKATIVTAGTKEEYLKEDLDIFDFALTSDEMDLLNAK